MFCSTLFLCLLIFSPSFLFLLGPRVGLCYSLQAKIFAYSVVTPIFLDGYPSIFCMIMSFGLLTFCIINTEQSGVDQVKWGMSLVLWSFSTRSLAALPVTWQEVGSPPWNCSTLNGSSQMQLAVLELVWVCAWGTFADCCLFMSDQSAPSLKILEN